MSDTNPSAPGHRVVIVGGGAGFKFVSLCKMHELARHGWVKVTLHTLTRLSTRRTEPDVKLH